MERQAGSPRSWGEHPRLMAWRQRSNAVDVAVPTIEAYGRHRSGRNAALISHYGFLSIFPLVLALTTILGFVLDGRPDLQAKILDSALARLPIIGQAIGSDPSELRGNAALLVFGLLAALWSGLRAFIAVGIALDDVRELTREQRSSFAVMRARALLGVAVIGGSQVGSATITSIAGAGDFATINRILLVIGALAINTATVGLTYRWLCSVRPSWREVLPGAVCAGFVFALMQFVGTTVVVRLIANASPVYGTFATVIGLFTWLALHATVALLSAELNEVLRRRRVTRDRDAEPLLSMG